MTPRPSLPNQSKLLITLDGKQRSAVSKAAKAQDQSMAGYIRGMIDERHPSATVMQERLLKQCPSPTHELTVRAKWLYDGCTSITDMIARLRAQAALLEEMRDGGMALNAENIDDDYARLVTDNPHVAARFKMDRIEE